MMLRPTINAHPRSLSHGGESDTDGQEVHKHHKGDGHDDNEDKKSLSGANKDKEEDNSATVMLGHHMPAAENLPLTIKDPHRP